MAKKIRIEDYEKTIKKSEQNIEPKKEPKKRDKLKICSLIINGIFAICLVVLLIMYSSLSSDSISKDEYDSMVRIKDSRINTLKYDSDNLNDLLNGKTVFYVKDKLEFMDDNIVFRIKGFGNYYYSYDCMMKKVNGEYEYWAYNKEAAISEGLRAGGC